MSKKWKVLIGIAVAAACVFGSFCALAGYLAFGFAKRATLFNEGVAAVNRDDLDTASSKFRAALKGWQAPDRRAYAFTIIGLSEERNGECEKALDEYSQALRIDPKSKLAHEFRGRILRDAGKTDDAFNDFSEAIRLDPNNHGAFVGRGLIDLSRKDFDQAIEDFSEAVRTDPDSASSYANRGLAYAYKRDFEQALINYDAALRLDPSDARALANRAGLYSQQKDFDRAIQDLTAAIQTNPRYGPTYRARASAYLGRKEYAKAVDDFEQALRMDPADDSTLNGLAWLRATCPEASYRNGKRAIEQATAACKISDWRNAGYIDTLAAGYAEVGDFKSAISYEDKAIRCDSSNDEQVRDMQERMTLYRSNKAYRQRIGE